MLGEAPQSAFDDVDRYFLALRVGSAAAMGLWLWRFAAPETIGAKGAALAVAYVFYSVALYWQVWRSPHVRAHAYLAALPADLVFLSLICLWSAQPMSGVYLGFYLLVALHAFYFGASIGIAAAAGFAISYGILYFSLSPPQRCLPEELVLRLAFAFLIASSVGLVSRQLRASRRRLSMVNRQLQHRNRILEQTYRHLSVGRLAGGVAHNINNPAAVIISQVELMRRRAEGDNLPQVYRQDLGIITEHAYRVAGVARSLVALSSHRNGTPKSLDVARVTDGVLLLFENRAVERRVRLERRLAPGLTVHGQESSLREVIVNLVCNALDAVEEGGEVVVETASGSEPQTIELRVRDDGHGIDGEHLEEIFSPFFSTKQGANGVGLGLSLSLTMVRRLGGTLSVESTPGEGSLFTVALPADASQEGREEPV